MLKVINQDIFKADVTMLIHQANCFGTMGAGIARHVKQLYPGAYEADREYYLPVGDRGRLGNCSVYETVHRTTGKPLLIVNAYGQYHYGGGRQTDVDSLMQAISQAVYHYPQYSQRIALPYKIGCGLAGGDWQEVEQELTYLSNRMNKTFYICKLGN